VTYFASSDARNAGLAHNARALANHLPQLPPLAPNRRYRPWIAAVGRGWLRLSGWRVEGEFPDVARCVIVVAPHSSNWDFVHGVAVVFATGLKVSFVAKHTLFKGPLGRFLRWVGGLPVDRARPHGLVESIVDAFARSDALWFAITPEGTRTRVARFKTGFYRVALAAEVPIFPVVFNYRRRRLILLPLVAPRDAIESAVGEMEQLFEQYGARRG
jgi:1-acyl-sn-glycerol-3-phosphate acyltransferase